jgi:hypothetical protein
MREAGNLQLAIDKKPSHRVDERALAAVWFLPVGASPKGSSQKVYRNRKEWRAILRALCAFSVCSVNRFMKG